MNFIKFAPIKQYLHMNYIVYDDPIIRRELLPMTYTRPVGALRIGIDTISEKWQSFLPGEYSWDVFSVRLN